MHRRVCINICLIKYLKDVDQHISEGLINISLIIGGMFPVCTIYPIDPIDPVDPIDPINSIDQIDAGGTAGR